MMSLLRVLAPGKFTLNSVRLKNDNKKFLGVKGFISSFIFMVGDQTLESHLPQGTTACSKLVSTSRPLRRLADPEHWAELFK